MSIKQQTKKQILELLISVVREKLETYTPETHYMPFHYRLLGRDRYAMFSLEFEVYRSKEDKKVYIIEREFLDKEVVKERKYLYKGERIPSVENASPVELFDLIPKKKGKLVETKNVGKL